MRWTLEQRAKIGKAKREARKERRVVDVQYVPVSVKRAQDLNPRIKYLVRYSTFMHYDSTLTGVRTFLSRWIKDRFSLNLISWRG
jgi:hypothetical protein